jgi:heterodisulfide reductase subunit B2
MKEFAYFPGCSLEKLALSYHESSLETAKKLGVELKELEDWNCCGATTYFHVDQLLAYTLVARNLAQAEKMGLDLIAPCSACYKNAYFTRKHILEDPDLAEHINFALEADNLRFDGNIQVHHLIEVFVNGVGIETIKNKVTRPLKGLRIAPYYGCQIVRPKKNGAEIENPSFFENLVKAMGAEPVLFPLKTRCCGGSLIMTGRRPALDMVQKLLQSALDCEADVIATACPLCQINLECYQTQVNEEFGTNYAIPVLYFTQLLGLALDIPARRLGIGVELVSVAPVFSRILRTQPG